ncbi:MAG: hypothetical protein HZB56_05320 [Deltaproteobacteria bacterium]|nr:hypothetical protein [Deltaproteobacteria bacterium]
MRHLALAVALAGCAPSSQWSQAVVDLPLHASEVIDAVAAMPECEAVRRGGVIRWRAFLTCGSPLPANGCAYPFERPPRVEVVYEPSALGVEGRPSRLAHELCHVCGYLIEAEADACAFRATNAARAAAGLAPIPGP